MWHKKCGVLGWICLILVVIGGINWGLIGLFSFNLVSFLVGHWPIVERLVYILVGIAAIIMIFLACKCCSSSCGTGMGTGGSCNRQDVPPSSTNRM